MARNLLLFGIALSALAAGPSAPPEISRQWGRDWSAKHLDQVLAWYADDAVFVSPDGGRFTGKPAIVGMFRKVASEYTADLKMHSVRPEQSATLGFDSGDYEETLTHAGATRNVKGTYLIVFRRRPGGPWRIVEQTWTDGSSGGH